MINYSENNILNIKKVQNAYRARKAKGPRNLPVNLQKKILNLLPLKNQASFINVLRNNSGNPLSKNYRKRRFITNRLLNKLVKTTMWKVRDRKPNRYKIVNHIDIGRVRIDKNQMKRFGLNVKGNKLIINYDMTNNINNNSNRGDILRSYPFNRIHQGYFLVNGLDLYKLNNPIPLPQAFIQYNMSSLNNRKYLGYIPKEISNRLRSPMN
jgi:hypothetical protein